MIVADSKPVLHWNEGTIITMIHNDFGEFEAGGGSMGRFRYVWSHYRRRNTVDEAISISVTSMGNFKLSQRKRDEGAFIWGPKGEAAKLHFSTHLDEHGEILLYLREFETNVARFLVDIEVNMYALPVLRGGERWFFECPVVTLIDGEPLLLCRRRCTVLFYNPATMKFGCRQCMDLTYLSKARRKGMTLEQSKKAYRAIVKWSEELQEEEKQAFQEKLATRSQSWQAIPRPPSVVSGTPDSPPKE